VTKEEWRKTRWADTVWITSLCLLGMLLLAMLAPLVSGPPAQPSQGAGQAVPEIPDSSDLEPSERELRPASDYASLEALEEDCENEKIEAALLERAQVIEDCTVTWYTSGTCGKRLEDSTYGITASGLPVAEHLK